LLYVAAADATGLQKLTFLPRRMPQVDQPYVFVEPVGWSADGVTLFYQWDVYSGGVRAADWAYTELYAIASDGTRNRRVGRVASLGFALPPVGDLIPYVNLDSEVTLIDVATGAERLLVAVQEALFPLDVKPSPAGTELYVAANYYGPGPVADVRAVDIATEAERTVVAPQPGGWLGGLAVGPQTGLLAYQRYGPGRGIHVVTPEGAEAARFPFPRAPSWRTTRESLSLFVR
jgi:hypothetical protein